MTNEPHSTNQPHPAQQPPPTDQPFSVDQPYSTERVYDLDGLTPLERELAQQLRQAGAGYQRVPGQLAEAGLRRGRARLWRRRAATVTGALAVVGVAVAVTQLPGGGAGGARFDGTPPAAAAVPETRSELVEALEELLPDELSVSGGDAVDVESSGDPSVTVWISDGQASYELEVAMLRWETDNWRSHTGCQDFGGEDADDCDETELPDGSVQTLLETDWTTSEATADPDDADAGPDAADTDESEAHWDDAGQQRRWEVWLESPTGWGPGQDGMRQLLVGLTLDEPHSRQPDLVPVLSQEQLVEIAHAPVWQRVFDRADTVHGAPGDSLDGPFGDDLGDGADHEATSDVPPEDILALFAALAPEGLEISEDEEQHGGSASLTLSDGEVSAEVDIATYAPGSFDDGGVDDPDCLNETLADSTTISLCVLTDEPGDEFSDGAFSLYADVYYPNGASIDILHLTTEGAEGPLNEEQLLEIASAPEWQELLR
ncbi:hypothetical protein [Streptomyces sp. NBRC 109706]|uniref:hypothetical protein n=1 Tax=Streptomyces sp. NBRC 109706 TaxID=1550035 RepID=UPI000781F090|nr:hypothetical protein [Streptomyces sp. NBRC 109706]